MATQFGAGSLTLSATASIAIARVQGVNLNMNFGDPVLLRWEGQKYPGDIRFADAGIEGSFTYSNVDITSLASMFGASGTFSATSGTFTVSAGNTPGGWSLAFSLVTDGITSTYTFPKIFVNSFTIPASRTEHVQYEANFVVMSTAGSVVTIQGA